MNSYQLRKLQDQKIKQLLSGQQKRVLLEAVTPLDFEALMARHFRHSPKGADRFTVVHAGKKYTVSYRHYSGHLTIAIA